MIQVNHENDWRFGRRKREKGSLGEDQTSLKWDSTIAVLSGTLAPAGTFFKNTDKICAAFMQIVSFYANSSVLMQIVLF